MADRQWDEALDILGQLAESSEGKLLAVTNRRYLSLRACCQLQLAALPPEALKLYRQRVDPIAKKWYEQGLAQRNRGRCRKSSIGPLPAATVTRPCWRWARWRWRRAILPPPAGIGSGSCPARRRPARLASGPAIPDTDLDLAAVRARLVLVSILEGKKGTNPTSRDGPEGAAHKLDSSSSSSRATEELAAFVRLHGEAQGRLGGHEGKYADLLGALLADSVAWPPAASDPNWVTFAGNSRRNRIASRLSDVGAIAWRLPLRPAPAAGDRLFEPPGASENPREPLSFHPLQLGNLVLVNDSLRILALRLDTGQPAWGRAAIYESQLSGPAAPRLPPEMLGSPRFTLTCFEDKLFARMGSPVTGQPQGGTTPLRPGCLVCLDLAAEGRLVWKIAPEEGWAFEGSPVADARGRLRGHAPAGHSAASVPWPVSTPTTDACAGGGSSAVPRRPPAASSTKARITCSPFPATRSTTTRIWAPWRPCGPTTAIRCGSASILAHAAATWPGSRPLAARPEPLPVRRRHAAGGAGR